MNDLVAYQNSGLPAQLDDLAKFMIVAQEKVKAVKAEIRAIQKLNLAKEVYAQKMEEQRRLQEVILLAYQRMGEITREMPKGSGNQYSAFSHKREEAKHKAQAIKDLGFSTSQVGRMEQMAAHPDIVEEVIAESQAGETEATQGEVLRRIKERRNGVIDLSEYREGRCQRDMARIDRDYENLQHFRRSIAFYGLYEITDEILDSVAAADADLNLTIRELEKVIQLLVVIKGKLTERRMQRG